MLSRLRSGSKSIVVKALLGLVALTFVLWGVGDVFRSSTARNVAQVGDVAISFEQFNETLQREVSRYSHLFGKQLGESEIAALGLRQQVVSQLVQDQLLTLRAKELNLKVGKDVVFQRIASTPIFEDESGKFNKEKFREVLRNNGLTEQRYIDALANDMAIGFLVTALLEAQPDSSELVNVLYHALHEQRVADLLVVPANQIKAVPEPKEDELLDYYNNQLQQFTIPEKRDVSYLLITPDLAEKELRYSDDQLEEWYEANQSRYASPEKREVSQYLFDTKEDAEVALEKLRGGESLSVESVDLGEVAKEGLPSNVTEAVFSLEKGEFSEVVQSDLGWHVFYVTKLIESKQPSFAEVKEKIRTDMRANQAENVFYQLTSQIEDDVAGGADLAKLAEKYALPINQANAIKITSRKFGDISDGAELVAVAFQASVGELSSLVALSDGSGYAILSVDKVNEQRIQSLDEVRARAIDSWKAMKKQSMTRELAQELATQIKEGAEISKLASVPGLSFLPQRTFGKPNGKTETEFPDAFVETLFSIQPSQTTSAYAMDDGGYVIGRLEHVVETEKSREEDADGYASVEQELKGSFNNELMESYFKYLETLYPVEINHDVIAPGSEE